MNKESKTLDLVLKHGYYDMIDAGEKPEEYRDLFKWAHRLLNVNRGNGVFVKARKDDFEDFIQLTWEPNKEFATQLKHELKRNNFAFRHYDVVRFHRGYTNTTMLFKCKGIDIGRGNPDWGAPFTEVFVIKLGERLTDMN